MAKKNYLEPLKSVLGRSISHYCQRVGNKIYLRHVLTETLDQIQNASTAQEKFKIQRYGFT